MFRKFLTLIALCVGFASVAEPARAAIATVESVQLMERAATTGCVQAAARVPQFVRVEALNRQKQAQPCAQPTVVVIVPTIMLRIDRARE